MAKITSSSAAVQAGTSSSSGAAPSASSPAPFAGQSFTRESLRQAELVAQVDRKYLLVKLPCSRDGAEPPGVQTLVLVDQHAASERIRVERYLDATAGKVVRGEPVATVRCYGGDVDSDPAGHGGRERRERERERIGIVVGKREYGLARRYRAVFARWGLPLGFDDDPRSPPRRGSPSPPVTTVTNLGDTLAAETDEGARDHDADDQEEEKAELGAYHQAWLESVPTLVANRVLNVRGEPHLARDLVRSFLAHLEQNGPGLAADDRWSSHRRHCHNEDDDDDEWSGSAGWASALKDAPPVLIDLLNSKACRGAIMFNDGESPLPSLPPTARAGRTFADRFSFVSVGVWAVPCDQS